MLFGENSDIWPKYSDIQRNAVLFGANAMHSTGFEEQSATSEESATYLSRVRLIRAECDLFGAECDLFGADCDLSGAECDF